MAFISLTTLLLYLGGLIAFLALGLFIYFKHRYKYWARLGVPYVPGSGIFGSMSESMMLRKQGDMEITEWYFQFKAMAHKYFGAFLFDSPFLVVMDPVLVKNVMLNDFNHFFDRGGYVNEEDDPLSANLFSITGMRWKHLRQKLTPTFTSGKLKKMFSTLVACTEELQSCLDDTISKGEPVDIKKTMVQYTTNVIGSCAFGIDCNSFKEPDSEFIRTGTQAFKPTFVDRMKMFFAFMYPKTAKFFRMRATNKDVDHFFRKLVRDTIKYREENDIVRNDFMHLLIQLKNKGEVEQDEDDEEIVDKSETVGTTLTYDEVAAQAFLFFVAGFETSSTAMTFCLYELAKNIAIQEQARKEIVSVLKKFDGGLGYEALMSMKYLERVIQETLRMHPPIMTIQREVTKDYKIPDTDVVLKKGLAVFIPVLGLQTDPDFYPEPEKFDPDRFTEEGKASRPDYTWLPFGDGPRVCIGNRFGLMQVKVGICRLLLNYKFTLNTKTIDPIELDPANFVRAVKGGVWLDAEKITS